MVLVIAFVPIVCLYLIWLPLTCMGKVKAADVPENEQFGRPTAVVRESVAAPASVNVMHEV